MAPLDSVSTPCVPSAISASSSTATSEYGLVMTKNLKDEQRNSREVAHDDPDQFQRFLEKAKELGLDPTSEADLHRFDDVLRRVAKLQTQRKQPVKGEGPRGWRPRKPE